MRNVTLAIVPLLVLVGCNANGRRHGGQAGNDDVPIAVVDDDGIGHVALNLPGTDAKVELPGIDLGRHVDLDGLHLAPGTKVGRVDVADGDHLQLRFTNTTSPVALIDFYEKALPAAGYGAIMVAPATLTASRGARQFALAVVSRGNGSAGTITLRGDH